MLEQVHCSQCGNLMPMPGRDLPWLCGTCNPCPSCQSLRAELREALGWKIVYDARTKIFLQAMTDTLRQKLEKLADFEGVGVVDVRHLQVILTETAAADAEVARLAEVGRVMYELLNPFTRDNDFAQVALYFNGVDAYCCWQEDDEGGVINRVEGDTLLDALRELAKKVEVK